MDEPINDEAAQIFAGQLHNVPGPDRATASLAGPTD